MAEGSEDKFQKETTYVRGRLSGEALNWVSRPGPYKEYPDSKKIRLPAPEPVESVLLDEVLKKRRSVRRFSKKPITKRQLSYLLWASSGVQRRERGYEFRTAPSAGALYPIETYIVVNRVEDLARGVYHYSVKSHLLEELKFGDFGEDVALAALEQRICSESAVVFIWTAIFARSSTLFTTM